MLLQLILQCASLVQFRSFNIINVLLHYMKLFASKHVTGFLCFYICFFAAKLLFRLDAPFAHTEAL